jgi:ribosomal protein L21E
MQSSRVTNCYKVYLKLFLDSKGETTHVGVYSLPNGSNVQFSGKTGVVYALADSIAEVTVQYGEHIIKAIEVIGEGLKIENVPEKIRVQEAPKYAPEGCDCNAEGNPEENK